MLCIISVRCATYTASHDDRAAVAVRGLDFELRIDHGFVGRLILYPKHVWGHCMYVHRHCSASARQHKKIKSHSYAIMRSSVRNTNIQVVT